MIQDNVVKLIPPAEFSDPLTEVLREGGYALLAQAVEAEVAAFLSGHADRQTGDGRQRLVRHGHRPERAIMTGLGPVAVRAPRVRDRSGAGARPGGPRRPGARREPLRVHVRDPAPLRPPLEEPRGSDPDPVPQGHLQR